MSGTTIEHRKQSHKGNNSLRLDREVDLGKCPSVHMTYTAKHDRSACSQLKLEEREHPEISGKQC